MSKYLLLLAFIVLVLLFNFGDAGVEAETDDVRTFHSREDLSSHIKKLNSNSGSWDAPPSKEELVELGREEIRIRLEADDIVNRYGNISKEFAEHLHKLGRVMYKQHKFETVFDISSQIVELHEKLDGHEHENTARALGNLGSVSFRLKRWKECEIAMNRALYIWIQKYGPESKEVLLHRGKMLTFQIPHAKTSGGLSFDDYFYNEL